MDLLNLTEDQINQTKKELSKDVSRSETVTKETLRVGMFVKHSWGCTMNRCSFLQVLQIEKSKVILGLAKSDFDATGYDQGHVKLIGAENNPAPVAYAKITKRGLKLCEAPGSVDWQGKDISWKVKGHHWDYLYEVQVGYSEFTYGD